MTNMNISIGSIKNGGRTMLDGKDIVILLHKLSKLIRTDQQKANESLISSGSIHIYISPEERVSNLADWIETIGE